MINDEFCISIWQDQNPDDTFPPIFGTPMLFEDGELMQYEDGEFMTYE